MSIESLSALFNVLGCGTWCCANHTKSSHVMPSYVQYLEGELADLFCLFCHPLFSAEVFALGGRFRHGFVVKKTRQDKTRQDNRGRLNKAPTVGLRIKEGFSNAQRTLPRCEHLSRQGMENEFDPETLLLLYIHNDDK